MYIYTVMALSFRRTKLLLSVCLCCLLSSSSVLSYLVSHTFLVCLLSSSSVLPLPLLSFLIFCPIPVFSVLSPPRQSYLFLFCSLSLPLLSYPCLFCPLSLYFSSVFPPPHLFSFSLSDDPSYDFLQN